MFTQVRDQFLSVWQHLSSIQRTVFIVLVVSALILIPLFVNWANTPNYGVAFSGLSESDAGQIVQKLTDQGIKYQLRDSTTILVPSNQVYEVRLSMARVGLPQGGSVGFELFTGGNTLGMTEFTQRVNYQRALEGELERTIGSMAAVNAVRVHIVTPEKALLTQDQAPTTASITIQEKTGYHLDAAQVRAITHLVGSSVENLKPENVVVVDVNGNMLASGTQTGEASASAETDNHRAVEIAAANDLQKRVQGLLDSALGPNRSVVQANVAMDWTLKDTTIEAYDPLQATIRSSQTVSEVYTTTGGTVGGIPGASTNLPTLVNNSTTSSQGANYRRNEHTNNYEITQTKTHEVLAPGKIDRISLSVLVDGITDTVQLDKLSSVISAAAGINTNRGDTLAVQSLAFDRTFYKQQAQEMSTSQQYDLYIKIGEVLLGILIMAGLLWYIQRLLANLKLASSQAWTPILKPVGEMALPGTAGAPGATGLGAGLGLTGYGTALGSGALGSAPAVLGEGMMSGYSLPGQPDFGAESSEPIAPPRITFQIPKAEAMSEEEEQLTQLVIQMAEENPATVAEIIQMWLNEDGK